MTKKDREKFFERVQADAERFCPDLSSIGEADIKELLAAAGTDIDALRLRLNDSVRKLAVTQRLKGNKVPAYLQDVIEMTGTPGEPASNPKIAVDKAVKWLEGFVDKLVPVNKSLTIQRAYRTSHELSKKDEALLDHFEQKLKDSVKKENE